METVTTPFGEVLVDEEFVSSDKLKSEIKALSLVKSIVDRSTNWGTKKLGEGRVIVSRDGHPVIQVNPLSTLMMSIERNEVHLDIELDGEHMCVLISPDSNCALCDGIVSLLLLGDAGWPVHFTPDTLRYKSNRAIKLRFYEKFPTLNARKVTKQDIDDYELVELLIQEGIYEASLVLIGQLARRWYTCKGMEIQQVIDAVNFMIGSIPPVEIQAYLKHPEHPSEALFLKMP